jgi:gas vesicle protein
MDEKQSGKLSTLMVFVAGGLIGAGLTLLIAPFSSGQIREKMESILAKAQEAIEKATEIEDGVKELIDKGKETISETQVGLQSIVKASKEAFQPQRAESLEDKT